MQAADPGKAYDIGRRTYGTLLNRTAEQRVLAEAEMGPVLIVVVDERVEQATEMVLVEHDDVVEQFPPNRGDEALRDPGSGRARGYGGADHRAAVVPNDEEHLQDAERR